MEQLSRITFDPEIMGGKPTIRGMRITVGTIVGPLASDRSFDEILDAYPYLEEDDLRQPCVISGLEKSRCSWRTVVPIA